jgi:AbrB family looped-hinge helix DNA binding protein
MKTTIDSAGRLVVPKPIRDAAGLRPGSELRIEYRDGRVEIEPVSHVRLERKGGLLVAVAPRGTPPMTIERVNRVIRDVREKRTRG